MARLTYSHRLRFLCACTCWHVLRSLAERHAMAAPGHPRRPPAAHSSCERTPLDSRGGLWAARRGVACGSRVRKVVGSYPDAVWDQGRRRTPHRFAAQSNGLAHSRGEIWRSATRSKAPNGTQRNQHRAGYRSQGFQKFVRLSGSCRQSGAPQYRAAGRAMFAQLCAWGQQCSAVPVWAVGPFADRRVLARKRGTP
jgi:hypothetical protein